MKFYGKNILFICVVEWREKWSYISVCDEGVYVNLWVEWSEVKKCNFISVGCYCV